MWCIPHIDAEYEARMKDLCELYTRPYDAAEPVVCCDEARKELHENLIPSLPLTPKQGIREDSHYRRNGGRNLFVAVEPKGGRRWIRITERRTIADFAAFFLVMMTVIYAQAKLVHWVLDNLNIHMEGALRKILGNHHIFQRVKFHYTPVHGSWLNQAEIEISTLSSEALADRIPNETILRMQVGAYRQYSGVLIVVTTVIITTSELNP